MRRSAVRIRLGAPNYLENVMANVKQGNLTKSPQWWKHLKDWKRVFWKSERKAQQKDVKGRLYE
jgi:hypothetical protein